MKQALLTLLLLAGVAGAANTTVTGTVTGPDGNPLNGWATVVISSPCIGAGVRVGTNQVRYSIVAGVATIPISLVPNANQTTGDTCGGTGAPPPGGVPPTWYIVQFGVVNGVPLWTDDWQIAQVGGSVTMTSVLFYNAPVNPPGLVNVRQLYPPGLAGSSLCSDGIGYSPGTCNSGAGPQVTVPCSSNPTLDFALGGVFTVTLNCTVSAISIAHLSNTTVALIKVCQDSSGSRGWPWPAAFHGAMGVGTMASKCSEQWFHSTDGVTLFSPGLPIVNQ